MMYTSANGIQFEAKIVDSTMTFSGIYALFNTIDGKMYIGKSVNIYTRMQDHHSSLSRNKHRNKHLQSTF